ncbi:hypothetical protein [Chengkuizengella axinellae]|uniref:ABC transporter permease n=1 Tax=Chengkuizengella axinellae TaxID=3064388 RepID=A0ABT9J151_9BACL|nr:hypothetical protein [Chengkuizengella sp. 2205SS18-9]MDP5275322.1 hypothetical protein [Chengkuizengella sp. 2205SS18-9]
MSRSFNIVKISYGIIKFPFLIFAITLVLVSITNFTLNNIFNAGGIMTSASIANIIASYLFVISAIWPIYFYKRIMSLGATRKEYYSGIIFTYVAMAAIFSLFNTVWIPFENSFLSENIFYYNIVEIFNWDQYGTLGSFLYQFFAYLLIVSFITLLFSCFNHMIGILLYIVLAVGIPISVSIGELRNALGKGLSIVFSNPSIWIGLALNIAFILIFFYSGWWFTKRREV